MATKKLTLSWAQESLLLAVGASGGRYFVRAAGRRYPTARALEKKQLLSMELASRIGAEEHGFWVHATVEGAFIINQLGRGKTFNPPFKNGVYTRGNKNQSRSTG